MYSSASLSSDPLADLMRRNLSVCHRSCFANLESEWLTVTPIEVEEDEDDLQEIDTDNIVGGRTRGKAIDYNKIDPSEFPEDEEDEDDDDFEDPDANHDAMQE